MSTDASAARPPEGVPAVRPADTASADASPTWHATLLAAQDNVAVALRPIAAGDRVLVRTPGGVRDVVALEAIPLCHKIAMADLAPGDDVLKYGCCIGEVTQPVARGAWVHTHNVVSRRARPRSGR